MIANVWGDTEDDYVAVVERIGADRRIAAIEMNVSCPNVVKGGMIFGNNPDALAGLVKRIRAATRHPLIVKLSPNVTDIVASARAAVDAGADALSLINTLVGLAIDLERREPKIGFTTGGLSGPAIRPVALRMVWEVRTALPKVPIFGMGGSRPSSTSSSSSSPARTPSRSEPRTSAILPSRAASWGSCPRGARITASHASPISSGP